MSESAIFLIVMGAMFPAMIIVAVAAKWWEVRKAQRWPSTTGRVIVSSVQAHVKRPGDPGYDFGRSEVTNEPLVEYEYCVDSRKFRGRRLTLGERTSGFELEEMLARYPVGASVTVYYDPANPEKAVLERDLGWGVALVGVGGVLLFFIACPLLAAFLYFNGVDWLEPHLANPGRAPVVAAAGMFGLLVLVFALAFTRYAWHASRWPTTPGRIVASGVDAYRKWRGNTSMTGRIRRYYRPSVQYTYEVNGRQYTGDRLNIGIFVAATFDASADRIAKHYPVGRAVDVYYNPRSPGEALLNPLTWWLLVPFVVAACVLTFAWMVAAGRM